VAVWGKRGWNMHSDLPGGGGVSSSNDLIDSSFLPRLTALLEIVRLPAPEKKTGDIPVGWPGNQILLKIFLSGSD
jgi:hypothetical protein